MSDGNKIRHNLALAYANNKLQIALQRGERPQGLDLNDPAQAACVLASWYSDCLEQKTPRCYQHRERLQSGLPQRVQSNMNTCIVPPPGRLVKVYPCVWRWIL